MAAREISAAELTQACLDDIAENDADLRSFINVTGDSAMREARAADRRLLRGESLGPLNGIPVGVKDNIDVAGVPTTCGASFLRDNIAVADAAVVAHLREAGAVILGKTNMHEFAWGASTENEAYGITRNPWDHGRNAHGSSGGSAAAVAAGFCVAALGTDTGGSIRNPAAVTGVCGLRPTVGRVSTVGVLPLAWSMDTVGPLARSVADIASVHSTIAGLDRDAEPTMQSAYRSPMMLSRMRIGVIRDSAYERCDPGVRSAFERAIRELLETGATVVDLDLPDIEPYYDAWLITQTAEASAVHTRWMRDHSASYSPEVFIQLEAGATISAPDYLQAQRYRQYLRERFLAAFSSVDVILTPTFAGTATPVGADPLSVVRTRFTADKSKRAFTTLPSVLAMPALSVPCGFSEGLPVGLQIISAPNREEKCLEFGLGYQALTDWHEALPPALTE